MSQPVGIVATLADLNDRLGLAVSGGGLSLDEDTCPVPRLTTLLPAGGLTLGDPRITLAGGTLTVAGACTDAWPVGRTGRDLHLTAVRVVFTGAAADPGGFAVQLAVEGGLTAGGTTVAVIGGLDPTGRITLALADGPRPAASLATFGTLIGGGLLVDGLPVGAVFDLLPLTGLTATFGSRPADASELTLTADATGTWPIVAGSVELRGIGVTLRARTGSRAERFAASAGGDVHATASIGGQDFTVRLALRGPGRWVLEVLPADGNVLPALGALAALAGADPADVDAGLRNLGLTSLAIDAVRIGLDLDARAVRGVEADASLTVDGVRFRVTAGLPSFFLIGRLDPAHPVDLRALAAAWFPAAAGAFPAAELNELRLAAYPDAGRYEISAAITTDFELTAGRLPIAPRSFAFHVVKDGHGVTGGVEAWGAIFGADFHITAEHAEAAGGWRFSCGLRPGQSLTVKAVHDQIVALYDVDPVLPAVIAGASLDALEASFDTGGAGLALHCSVSLPVGDAASAARLAATVDIRVSREGTGYRKEFTGTIEVAGLQFDLHLLADATATRFVATYRHTEDGRRILVRDLLGVLSADLAAAVPEDLTIDLKDVVLAVDGGAVLGLDLGASLSLSGLPLVGRQFPAGSTAAVDNLRLVVASREYTAAESAALSALLPATVAPLPAPLPSGATITARLALGGGAPPRDLTLPMAPAAATQSPTQPQGQPQTAGAGADPVKWFDVQRSAGPVYFDRIGFEYADGQVRFLLDAALSLAGLTLSLDGLTLGSPIDHFAPSFDLRGIGVDYRSGPVEVGGALLRTTVREPGKEPYDEYDGAAVIRTSAFAVTAVGGYVYLNGQPSMFVYAVLDKTLGGPPFFTVTGLAAGFGYNRSLVLPPITGVADFPLVATAVSGAPTGTGEPRDLLRTALTGLRQWVPPTAGQMFLAAGVRFSSFQMIDSFALLAVSFGETFELDVLGISTLVAPRPEPAPAPAVAPLAELQLAVRASFQPDAGVLSVAAQLTQASFLFSHDCHLTGGFAFTTWFAGEHDGDFVLSVGGYHPQYAVPAHYPKVPRIGFNWQYDQALGIKGDAYYALTPAALMAGGHLEVVWQSGNLRAAFTAGVDFLIAWKPYHYDARAYVDFNVSYTFDFFGTHHISVDVGADLHIWGPDFAGTAHISLWIISFDVAFGAQNQTGPAPIDWPAFRRFLPAADPCTLTAAAGLIREQDAAPTGSEPTGPRDHRPRRRRPAAAAAAGRQRDPGGRRPHPRRSRRRPPRRGRERRAAAVRGRRPHRHARPGRRSRPAHDRRARRRADAHRAPRAPRRPPELHAVDRDHPRRCADGAPLLVHPGARQRAGRAVGRARRRPAPRPERGDAGPRRAHRVRDPAPRHPARRHRFGGRG
nr:hypothetical protein GCM10020063_038840 [Dactylosporangium thailandense]